MKQKVLTLLQNSILQSSFLMIAASFVFNALNYLFVVLMGRMLPLNEFGTLTVLTSLFFLIQVPSNALANATQRFIAYLDGKPSAYGVYIHNRRIAVILSLVSFLGYLAAAPLLKNFFKLESISPILWFSPVLLVLYWLSLHKAVLAGKRKFGQFSLVITVEGITKVASAFFLVLLGLNLTGALTSFSISMLLASLVAVQLARWKPAKFKQISGEKQTDINQFLVFSAISSVGLMLLYSIDIILIKHFLDAQTAGQYALLTLFGKMILLGASAFSGVILPHIAYALSAPKKRIALTRYGYSLIISFVSILTLLFNVFPETIATLLLGERALLIADFLPRYSIAMALLAVAAFSIQVQLTLKRYWFTLVPLLFSALLSSLLWINHASLLSIIVTFQRSSLAFFVVVVLAELSLDWRWHWQDLKDLLQNHRQDHLPKKKRSILIFNWRDTKHVWSGGAEVYVHELAKRWVQQGYQVTLFCSNDRKHARYQKIDGVEIIRRGGFYTTYIWGFLYYIFQFRGQFDYIVDSENGIPFFTPLYTGSVPVFLLIHHVHQDIFREHLVFPLDRLAMALESILMPLVYRSSQIITTSKSSKKAITQLGFKANQIHVFNPGVDLGNFHKSKKTKQPSFIYLGRLKSYKRIHLAILAFKNVVQVYPKATLTIAGSGDQKSALKQLVNQLKLQDKISFTGRVSETKKTQLLGSHWAMLQPSQMEGWGITVIEANACGTPVIASNVPGLRDSVVKNKTGLLFKDPDSLSKLMIKLIRDKKLYKNLSINAVNWAQNFSWSATAKAMLSHFESYEFKRQTFIRPQRFQLAREVRYDS